MSFYNQPSRISGKFENFVCNFTPNPELNFDVYAKGYKEAAELLTKSVLDKSRFADYEAYPIVFLYRHAFELYIKALIINSSELFRLKNQKLIRDIDLTHDLEKSLRTASEILSLLYPNDNLIISTIKEISRTAAEISAIDKDSFSFRYPITKKGNASTDKNLTINIRQFSDHMSEVLNSIDTIVFGVNMEITKY